ncbi:FGGY-family carbohydrate kinase [Deinococcus cellulosilyticus]|uniref:Sugar kinase n=1 Tax=Deinococcus cellulosilyticus (strain DSM 18568 / NBRC 106333 / KACC 11606 / 5516J-15) TaxID=1223518 RepID=A0A511N9U9_DEIC1|nr:FGGY-family carbohydrate kinase [Deinococcus cellulosilyticus]GEM49570.1 sugar kinase [Deinococcus cellulosilyticus NBRC 106333 = KACC 11606]
MTELLLGIDVGTSSTKGVLTDLQGTLLKTHVVEHGVSHPQPGWAEQDADEVWWKDVVQVCRNLLDGSPYTGENVVGMAVSAIGPCLLPLDAQGNPLRPGILYGVDTRATEEIRELNALLGEDAIYSFSKMHFTSQAIGPKIKWLRKHEPEIWSRTAKLTTASSYLVFKLTSRHVMDRHTASHYMPLMDGETLEWSGRYAGHFCDLSMLPELGWSDEIAGSVTPEAARITGLREGTPVTVGAVDALSEALSVGVAEPGDLMVMYGSTTFFILVQDTPTPDPRVWTVGGAFKGQLNLAAGMATTGALTGWFREQLAGGSSFSTLFHEATFVPPGSAGLLVLPYFSGERTPINDPRASGIFAGLNLSHTRAHLFRATLEGVAFGIRHNLETFRDLGADINRVVAVGGGAQSRMWPQIVSDVCNMEQVLPEVTVGASYGNAFLAGLASGHLNMTDLKAWSRPREVLKPGAHNHQIYSELYPHFLALYQQNRGLMHELHRFHTKSRNQALNNDV